LKLGGGEGKKVDGKSPRRGGGREVSSCYQKSYAEPIKGIGGKWERGEQKKQTSSQIKKKENVGRKGEKGRERLWYIPKKGNLGWKGGVWGKK